MVITPPKTTDGTTPINLAAIPDSKLPISLDELIKIEFTDETLPRIVSGVYVCMTVDRIMTLTLSIAPIMNKQTRDKMKLVETAKQIVKIPNKATLA